MCSIIRMPNLNAIRPTFSTYLNIIIVSVAKAVTLSAYVFVQYVQLLKSLLKQNKMNVSFREIVRLVARNH